MTERPTCAVSLDCWLDWLDDLNPQRIELGLQRVGAIYSRLPQLDRSRTRVVTVAGTNGKGTAVAALEALALAGHQTTLAYFSPHIERFTERFRLNGEQIDEARLVMAFEAVARAWDSSEVQLTYFEFITLAALVVAAEEAPDLLLLEVGLGGRLDAVNLIDADLCLLTSIGLDHQQWLGDNRNSIAREKLGICRPAVPLVCSDRDPPQAVAAESARLGFPLYLINRDFQVSAGATGQVNLEFRGRHREIAVAPGFHPDSLACSLVAAELLGLAGDPGAAMQSLTVNLPGRFECCSAGARSLILDVAHNPAAWQALAARLEQPATQVDLLLGTMADKAYAEAFPILQPYVRHFYLVQLPLARAVDVVELRQAALEQGIAVDRLTIVDTDMLRQQLQLQTEIPLLASGSFYTVALVKNLLREP